MNLLVLSADDLRRALPMADAVEAMKRAFADFSAGRATVPQRAVLDLDDPPGAFLIKPAVRNGGEVGAKLLTYLPTNPDRDLPRIHALVLLFDRATGAPAALCEGAFLTAWRTGAASGAATDLLARGDASRLAILGAGVQARTQLLAVAAVRTLDKVWVHSPRQARREAFAREMAEATGLDIEPAGSAAVALARADIVCAATSSSEPVLDGGSVRPGTHVNGVGSFTPEMCELDGELIRRARVFVDSRASAELEAGELIDAARRGLTRRDEWTELGEVVEARRPGRTADDEITFFKSVGLAIQDTVAAAAALDRARRLGCGVEVQL